MSSKILWADDDSLAQLKSLGWFIDRWLRDKGEHAEMMRTTNYQDAKEYLRHGFQALLLDVVLPHAEGYSSLSRYHGLELADRAAQSGVNSIVFLTVVPREQVDPVYRELQTKYQQVRFGYHSKLELAVPNKIDTVMRDLLYKV